MGLPEQIEGDRTALIVRALAHQLADGAVRRIHRGRDDRTARCIRIGDRDPTARSDAGAGADADVAVVQAHRAIEELGKA